MSSELKLKPCPFCGNTSPTTQKYADGYGVESWRVECVSCWIAAAHGGSRETIEEATEAWNRRAAAPSATPPASREEWRAPIETIRDVASGQLVMLLGPNFHELYPVGTPEWKIVKDHGPGLIQDIWVCWASAIRALKAAPPASSDGGRDAG